MGAKTPQVWGTGQKFKAVCAFDAHTAFQLFTGLVKKQNGRLQFRNKKRCPSFIKQLDEILLILSVPVTAGKLKCMGILAVKA